MEITAVRLVTRDLAVQRAFYPDTLGLPLLAVSATAFMVRAGATTLTFEVAPDEAHYHIAFNIPENKLAAAKAWLVGRASLLTQGGADEFDSADWNANQVYFCDPAGNILEFIARHNLANAASGDFDVQDILNISEVGLPVDDVAGTVAALTADLGLPPFGEQGEAFAPVGDDQGLFIVVQRGRHWFPTAQAAETYPATVTIRGERVREYRVGETAYVVRVE